MFLDTSAIIEDLGTNDEVTAYVNEADVLLTSTYCVTEILLGRVGTEATDIGAERARFSGIRSVEFTERLARESAALQDELMGAGQPMNARDLMIAATAISVDDELVVADDDFGRWPIQDRIEVTRFDPVDLS